MIFGANILYAVIKHVQNVTLKLAFVVFRLMDAMKYRGGVLEMSGNVVKSRRVGGSIVITMPDGVPNLHYEVSKTLGGTYIYTPMVKRSVKPSAIEHQNTTLDVYGCE